jgi:hypothetical protein
MLTKTNAAMSRLLEDPSVSPTPGCQSIVRESPATTTAIAPNSTVLATPASTLDSTTSSRLVMVGLATIKLARIMLTIVIDMDYEGGC